MARKCPDGRWSAIQSIFPDDCVEHMNVNAAVAVVLFFMTILLAFCIWASYWEWVDRDEKFWQEERRRDNSDKQRQMYRRDSGYGAKRDCEYGAKRDGEYGATFVHGGPYDVYQVYGVQP